jgi:nucleolar protein 15
MNGYIMFGRSLKCEVIPNEKVHPKMFVGANKKYFPKRTKVMHRKSHNSVKSSEQLEKNIQKLLNNEEKKRKKIERVRN